MITCPDCGFTAEDVYFNIEESEDFTEAECSECGNWTTL